ncbi:MAG TPA: HlyD family secretion protein [Terriglobales bacterium]|nr:HlyD family secretion protein [Terriglobales bacterium]
MPDSNEESKHAVITEDADSPREPFPEEVEDRSKGAKAKAYFRTHPGAKWALIILAIAAVAAGVWLWHYYSTRESTDDAQVDGHIYSVTSRVSGTVISLNFLENDHVKAGQVLAQLDPKDYDVAVQRAQAELADAQANASAAKTGVPITHTTTTSSVSTARANLNAAQKEVDAAQARTREAQANYNKAAQDLKRFEQLVKRDEISQQQYDAALAAEQAAKATLDASYAQVATAQSHVAQAQANLQSALTAPQQVAVTRARYGAANANVQMREAALAQSQLNLSYTTVRAPVDGIAGRRAVQVGQLIQAGQPITSVVDVNEVWVTANFKETQLHHMRVGQTAKIHVDAYDMEIDGKVDSIGGATGARFSLLPPENATGNFVKVVQRVPVKIVFPKNEDPDNRLRPGMSVDATVITK